MFSNKGKYTVWKFLGDYALISVLSTVFYIIHHAFFYGTEWKVLFSISETPFGFWPALVCLPAFVVGYRIKKSPELFYLLSWLTVGLILFVPILLAIFFDFGVSYSIGYREVVREGIPTPFGFFYKLSTPWTVMAIFSTWLLYRHG